MVKSKKMSKSSIAVIVLALLLVLSMIMGMTGAWFTATTTDADTREVTFGSIVITTDETAWTTTTAETAELKYEAMLMPGDKLSYAGTVENQGDPAYVFVKFVATIEKISSEYGDVALPAGVTLPAGWTQLKDGEGQDVANVFYVKLDSSGTQSAALEYNFVGDNYGNQYQNARMTASLHFAAAQQANLADAYTAYTKAGIAELLR